MLCLRCSGSGKLPMTWDCSHGGFAHLTITDLANVTLSNIAFANGDSADGVCLRARVCLCECVSVCVSARARALCDNAVRYD